MWCVYQFRHPPGCVSTIQHRSHFNQALNIFHGRSNRQMMARSTKVAPDRHVA
ncbi:hypothetical protein ACQ4M5_34780 [Leptolyngbya sp. AN10]